MPATSPTRLAIRTVLIHPLSSLLSAYGMGLADIGAHRGQGVDGALSEETLRRLASLVEKLGAEAVAEVAAQGIAPAEIVDAPARAIALRRLRHCARGRFHQRAGDAARVRASPQVALRVHRSRKGNRRRGRQCRGDRRRRQLRRARGRADGDRRAERPSAPARFYSNGAWREAQVYLREHLPLGARVDGPALVIEPHQTIVVEDGWRAEITAKNHVVMQRVKPLPRREAIGAKADPVMLEIFNNLFMSIAEQMGVTLQNTAYSVNIKERLDFSCAVFDAEGQLVANAPHMPVHLGSMDRSVETIIRLNAGRIRVGDVFVLNAPYNGGTHLPDITVCTPVFDDAGEAILFWTASRGHHADVGGISPGSMSPRATNILEEGVYIDNFLLVDAGRFREAELYELLRSGPYPARNPLQNVNDLKAQIAANEKGAQELRRMVASFSLETVQAYMGHVQDNAAESVRRVIDRLKDSEFATEMDQGAIIKVKISVDKAKREATVDFTGTSPQQPSNFNAPEPVARAAVLYVFRVMVEDEIPMNAGCLRPIKVIIPEGSMLSPRYPAAVVAGNVETSQAVTDTLFGALGALGSAQGTMNNLTFGNAAYQYYETICSGAPPAPASTAPAPSTPT